MCFFGLVGDLWWFCGLSGGFSVVWVLALYSLRCGADFCFWIFDLGLFDCGFFLTLLRATRCCGVSCGWFWGFCRLGWWVFWGLV